MLALLRKNMIANPEKLLLDLVDEQLAYLDQLAKEHLPKDYQTPNSKLNKVSGEHRQTGNNPISFTNHSI